MNPSELSVPPKPACIYIVSVVKNNLSGKGEDLMLNMIKENIRGFLDSTVFLTMMSIGLFAILSDYRYFKRVKFQKDAATALGIGIAYILLPFVFLLFISL